MTAPDADFDTLHVRCGSDIRGTLAEAGFRGAFFEFADPVCQGPMPADDAALPEVRTRFVAAAYNLEISDVRRRMRAEAEGLAATTTVPRVICWFEHDVYDQLILARLLAHYAGAPRPARLELICVDSFPGVTRFIGLGQLSADALRLLWQESRRPVDDAQIATADRAWAAFRANTPEPLAALVAEGTPALPFLGPALARMLRELPAVGDGLSLTERRLLQAVKGGAATAGAVFDALIDGLEPAPFLGGIMAWRILRDLALGARPLLEVEPEDAQSSWPRSRVRLTEDGAKVLAGHADWRDMNGGVERWVGGIRLAVDAADWRWDEAVGRPVRR